MPLKKTVAMERRIDLASLFCLIARHGPAVLVTLLVLGCSLAGFIMFRNMREKRRRRRTRRAAAAGSDSGDGDAALGLGEDEEGVSRRGSTDDEDHVYHSHARHRRAAPERTPYKDKLPDEDDAVDRPPYSFFWQRYSPKATESHVEEFRRDYNSERNFSHTSTEAVTDELCGAKEPGLTNDVAYEEKEKVIEADSSEDITSTTEDVSDEEFAQEADTAQFTFSSQLCSTPSAKLSANDGAVYSEEINIKPDEPEDSIAPVLEQDEILSAPCIEDQKLQCGELAAVPDLDHEEEVDVPSVDNTGSTTLSADLTEEDLVETSHIETCESGSFKFEDTKEDCSLGSTTDNNVVSADMSSNSLQQSEPPESPVIDTDIDQNALCPQESHFETDINTGSKQKDIGLEKAECHEETFRSNSETVSNYINVEEDKSLNHQETTEREEIQTSIVQNQQCLEILPQSQDGYQACTNNLNDQNEKTTVLICKESILNVPDQKEGQSSPVYLKPEECLVHPPASQIELNEVMQEETSLSGLPTEVKEITVTDTTAQTNHEKRLEGTSELDRETTLPPALPSQISENENGQINQIDKSVDTNDISATTRDKLEIMVEQMVAEACKDVKALEGKFAQENKSSELAQDNAITHDNLAETDIEKEMVITSKMADQSTEELVNSVNNISKVENEVQKDVVVNSDASENKCLDATSNDGSNMSGTEAVLNSQDVNQSEKEEADQLVMDQTVGNETTVSEVAQVKSIELEQTPSLEQLDDITEQPILNINSVVHESLDSDPIVEVIEQEACVEGVYSNMAAQVQTEINTFSSPEVSDFEKVNEVVENVATSYDSEKSVNNESEVLDTDKGPANKTEPENGNVYSEKREGAQEIPSGIKAEISENATSNEVQTEQKGLGMPLDAGSNSTVKSKVVIVCRTLESSISTVEMSDGEDVEVDDDISHLDLISCKTSSCQDHLDVNKNPADLVACSDDTITVQTVAKEMETGKHSDLVSGVTLDIPQDCSASMKSSEAIEQKDDVASTPSLESGISSMAVSPEKEESCKVISQDTLTTCHVYAEEKLSCSVFTSDGVFAVNEESSMEIRPLASGSLQISVLEETSDDLSVTNEDSFGSEIEDDYVRATEELMMKVVNNFASNDMKKEAVKLDEKKEQARVANVENGEKVDSEKTEISIMEATMDHNEWITEGNYQVLPWMAAASLPKDSVSSKEAADVESKLQAQASTSEERMENAKKVLAVQPMPQNVNVTFRIHYVTLSPSQTLAVTGDQPELGAWKSVIPLEKTKDGYWNCVVSLPAESHVEWKFVVLEKGEVCRWEECGNRLLYTGYGDDLLVHKWWGFL